MREIAPHLLLFLSPLRNKHWAPEVLVDSREDGLYKMSFWAQWPIVLVTHHLVPFKTPFDAIR
jgi:hypothetical protein